LTVVRYVELTSRGLVRCMSQTCSDQAVPLLRALLLRNSRRPWETAELAQLVPDESAAAVRMLFRLQRENCIDVTLAPPDDAPFHWEGVRSDLAAMLELGASAAVLLDADGMVLAHAGGGQAADDGPARPRDGCARLLVGEGELARVYELALRGLPIDECRPIVRLARRLARAWMAHAP